MIGDLVLINSGSKCNLAGQRAATRDFDTPSTTHVALMVGTYRAVHAMPAPEHVGLTLTHDLLSPDVEWSVWRHRALCEETNRNSKKHYGFLWQAELFIGERYNNPMYLKKKKHHSFCSELIGKVYSQFGIDFSSEAEKLLPILITKSVLANPETWIEVTSEYLAIRAEPLYQRLHDKKDSKVAKKAKAAFLSAKAAANEAMALFGEAVEGLDRFERWNIEKHSSDLEVWSHSSRGSQLSHEAAEWLALFTLDRYEESFRDLFGSTHN